MSLKQAAKLVAGVALIVAGTTWLPFFDSLPWNLPGYAKRAVVRECLRELAARPAVTAQQYDRMRRDSGNGVVADVMQRLRAVYPSPLSMIFRQIQHNPDLRAWGLIAAAECFPAGSLQGKYAPPLKPMIRWLKDADPIVASNALNALQTYVELPPDYFAVGGPCSGEKLRVPADWHAVYDSWHRKESPAWSQADARYFCERNWPPPIQSR